MKRCEWCGKPATGYALGFGAERDLSCGAHGRDWQPFPGEPTPAVPAVTAHAAVLDAVFVLEKYDELSIEARQGQGYTMLLEIQARALVSIALSLATPGE